MKDQKSKTKRKRKTKLKQQDTKTIEHYTYSSIAEDITDLAKLLIRKGYWFEYNSLLNEGGVTTHQHTIVTAVSPKYLRSEGFDVNDA